MKEMKSGARLFTQPFIEQLTGNCLKQAVDNRSVGYCYSFTVGKDTIWPIMVPDGCADIVVVCNKENSYGLLCGGITRGSKMSLEEGTVVFGVRYRPGVVSPKLGLSGKELLNHKIDLHELEGGEELIADMLDMPSFEDMVETFSKSPVGNALELIHSETTRNVFDACLQQIQACNGNLKIHDLEEETGYSARYLNQVFNNCAGISPKTYCKITRFHGLLQKINECQSETLTTIAADTGYYDQSHMLQEFKEYTTMNPRQYRKLIASCGY